MMCHFSRPIGAWKLSNLLTGATPERASFCHFFSGSVKAGLCGRTNLERGQLLVEADPTSAKGKFTATRFKMADWVEKTFVRVELMVFLYMFCGVIYSGAKASEVGQFLYCTLR